MASSDEEGEILPQCVTDYYLVTSNQHPVLFSILPLQLSDGVDSESNEQVFLRGTVDSGIQKIFREIIAWKFELSFVHPEILVLSKSKNWIKLQNPRKSYEDFVRSTLVTVYLLHLAKKNPDASATSLWSHLQKLFSTFVEGPSEKDILHHINLISAALSMDKDLVRSKYLLNIVRKNYGKEVTSFENAVPTARIQNFVIDDKVGDAEGDTDCEDCEDDMDEHFDRVCSLCDDGGDILSCDGRCMRSFHATKEDGEASGCESLGFTGGKVHAISSFMCQNCIDQRHQCFACGRLGSSDIGSGAEVFPCISATCGHFFHPVCVAKLIHPEDATRAADIQTKIAKGESFTCPAHRCSFCKQLEDKTIHELQFAVCRRCPTSYHRKCLPKSISFECTNYSPRRAWDGLLINRVLIYCLKHRINPELKTPDRDHILFSDTRRSGMGKGSPYSERMQNIGGSNWILRQNIGSNISKTVDWTSKKTKGSFSQASFSPRKRLDTKFSKHPSNYSATIPKPLCSGTGANRRLSARTELVGELLGGTSAPQVIEGADRGKIQVRNNEKRSHSSSLSNQAAIKEWIAALKKTSDASFNEIKFRSNMSVVSTYSSNPRNMLDEAITQGRVDAAVKAVREALRKLDEGGTIDEAKTICEPRILNQIMTWQRKLRVYLAPFLHGRRYSSYGRHFTKSEKLQEVVNRLHDYVLDGDMIVDFCCGSNDFSCLMKKKLDETGKCCSFRNYDIIQPKNDFCFENRDWMSVAPTELPDGRKLVMGLNPPFGVRASLANKFINKALEFKPKLLILIVPEETKSRLDNKDAYDLIWEDRKILSGKAFYLPGSLDVHEKQIEQWNNSPPPLFLWSRADWSNLHRGIAKQQGHAFMEQEAANERCDRGAPIMSNYLMEDNDDCFENFSRILDDISDHDYPSENEQDEVIEKKRKHGVSMEDTVLNGTETSTPVKKSINQFAFGASSTPHLSTRGQSNDSLRKAEPCLTMPHTNSKSSSTIKKTEIIRTTQGFTNHSQSVPAKSHLGSKTEVNLHKFGRSSQISSAGAAAVGATNEVNFSTNSGSGKTDRQTNLEVQSNPYIPLHMQQHCRHDTLPYGNNWQNQDCGYHEANFPQDAHQQYVPQYMPLYYVYPCASGAPLIQQNVDSNDDLPTIPGLGTYPSSFPSSCPRP